MNNWAVKASEILWRLMQKWWNLHERDSLKFVWSFQGARLFAQLIVRQRITFFCMYFIFLVISHNSHRAPIKVLLYIFSITSERFEIISRYFLWLFWWGGIGQRTLVRPPVQLNIHENYSHYITPDNLLSVRRRESRMEKQIDSRVIGQSDGRRAHQVTS